MEFHSCVAATGKQSLPVEFPMDMRPEPTVQTVPARFSSGGEGKIVAEDCLTWNDDFRVAIVGYPDLEPLRVGITRHDLMFRGRRVTMHDCYCAAEASAPREKRRLNPSPMVPAERREWRGEGDRRDRGRDRCHRARRSCCRCVHCAREDQVVAALSVRHLHAGARASVLRWVGRWRFEVHRQMCCRQSSSICRVPLTQRSDCRSTT